jgi:hypothetical protein
MLVDSALTDNSIAKVFLIEKDQYRVQTREFQRMHTSDGHSDNVGSPAIADTVGPLLRDGLVPATVDNDLLILDADANQVVRIACADATIADITAVLDTYGLLAPTNGHTVGGAITTTGLSRRRMLQGAAAAGVVGVTVLTLPTAAMAQSVNPNAPQNVTAEPGDTEVTVRWNAAPGTGITYTVYYRQAGQTFFTPFETTTVGTSLTVTGLTNNLSTEFYVVASPGGQSATITATPTAALWTGVDTAPVPPGLWSSPATNGTGTWVVARQATADQVMRSDTNGITWSLVEIAGGATGTDIQWSKAGFGNGRFMVAGKAVSGTTARVAYSSDGTSWTVASGVSVPDGGWRQVVWANPNPTELPDGRWVAVADSGTNGVMTSDNNGVSWTARTAPAVWRGVATNGAGIWVAVANAGTNRVMRSTNNGGTWNEVVSTVAAAGSWQSVAYGNGVWIAVGASGDNRMMRSTDNGETWDAVMVAESNWQSVATNGLGTWVAVASFVPNRVIRSTNNGLTWSVESAAGTSSNLWSGVGYGNLGGRFLAVAFGPTVPTQVQPVVMYRS